MDSCTSRGVERKRAMYAPEILLMNLFLLSRIRASSRAGITARATDTTASSRVYARPCRKYPAYAGRKEKLKKLVLLIFSNRLFHHISGQSFLL